MVKLMLFWFVDCGWSSRVLFLVMASEHQRPYKQRRTYCKSLDTYVRTCVRVQSFLPTRCARSAG